ncbi:MAG: methyltransferase [Bacteroidia bacterium]|nr:methyltransferase [Bacteroidia bacterium]
MHNRRRIEELRALLTAEFPLRELFVDTGTQLFTLFTAEDIEALISNVSADEFNKDERLPYWAELWHSAVALAAVLNEAQMLPDKAHVMEIGCGLGLPGLVAAQRGAQVTFSDYDRFALWAAELNLRSNLPGVEAEFLELDFRQPPSRQWPLILAADVIYEKRFVEPLAAFLDATLTHDGQVLLAEPNRLIAVPFFETLTARGFRYERQSRFPNLHGRTAEVSVYTIQRRA